MACRISRATSKYMADGYEFEVIVHYEQGEAVRYNALYCEQEVAEAYNFQDLKAEIQSWLDAGEAAFQGMVGELCL